MRPNKLRDLIMTDESKAVAPEWLDNDRGARVIGYSVVGALAAVVLLWGVIAPIESAALAPGVVQVEGKRKAVQHLEGGIVTEILAGNGDWVAENQPLLQMDTTQTRAELQMIEGRRYNLLAMADRLVAERDDLEAIVFRDQLQSISDDSRAASAMAGEVAIFKARLADRRGEAAVLEQRISQLEQQIKGLDAVRGSQLEVVGSLEEEILDLKELLSEGYVDKQRLRELERSRARSLGDIADIDSQLAAANVAVVETKLQILQLIKRFKTGVIDELKDSEELLYEVEQQFAAISDRVRRATVRAPAAGFVLGSNTTTIGAVVSAGAKLMQIVPSVDSLVIEARVSPLDIDRVRIGQPAEIRFSVFKDAYLVSGKLTKLSADRLIDEASNLPYYSAEIALLEEDKLLLEGMDLIPGMPAEVLIKTGERTMLGYLTSPLNRVFSTSLIED
jgi:epimerase transport system membrane fusion protein